jgi:hypothetical protein
MGVALLAACGVSEGADEPTSLEALAQKSAFIFMGTVTQLQAASMPGVPVSDHTIVVRVDETLSAAPKLDNFTGKDVTVYLTKPGSAEVGQTLVFFTNGWLYGKGLAVQEVGRLEAKENRVEGVGGPKELRSALADLRQKEADRALVARMARAPLVISGKVLSIQPAPGVRRHASEHDPDWWEATIEVNSAHKGTAPGNQVTVKYPNSKDELWIDSPKFQVGEEGTWILQMNQTEKGTQRMRIEGYTALNPLDFQPKDRMERTMKLLKAAP